MSNPAVTAISGTVSTPQDVSDIMGAVINLSERAAIDKEVADKAMSDAEAWAVGIRDGTEVTDDDETYHNNSKYYCGQAADHAASAGESAEEAGHDKEAARVSAENAAESERLSGDSARAAAESAENAAGSESNAAEQSRAANESAQSAADSAESAARSAEQSRQSADSAEGFAQNASDCADRAEQAMEEKGYIWFDIVNESLMVTSTTAGSIDFQIGENQYLEVIYA